MSLSSETRNRRVLPDSNPPAVASDGRLLIDLGGTMVSIISTSGPWLAEARDRYGSFAREGAIADIEIKHTVDEAAMIERHGCLSAVSPGGCSAEIAAVAGTDVLDGVLRTLLPPVIAPELMVHGALLSDGVRGFLCCGVSGSGKSTVAALFPEAALCDEMVRLAVGPVTEARSLPFWRARPATVPLGAVFVLEHGTQHRRIPLVESEAIRILRRHVYWPVGHEDLVHQSFEALAQVCRGTPIFRLAFRPETSVWTTMTEGF